MSEVKQYRKIKLGDIGYGLEELWGISIDGERALLSNAVTVLASDYDRDLAEMRRQRDEAAKMLKEALAWMDEDAPISDVAQSVYNDMCAWVARARVFLDGLDK